MSSILSLVDVRKQLTDHLAHALAVPPEQIDPDAKFVDLGADSILMASSLDWLQRHFGVMVTMDRLFEDLSSVRALAAFLCSHDVPTDGAAGEVAAVETSLPATRGLPTSVHFEEACIALMREQLQLFDRIVAEQNALLQRLKDRPHHWPAETGVRS